MKKSIKNQLETKENICSKQNLSMIKGADRYEWERKVGAGTFGTVHKVRDRKTLEIVAIKKVFQDPKYKNRY
jgi:serine/threonine protein kinase